MCSSISAIQGRGERACGFGMGLNDLMGVTGATQVGVLKTVGIYHPQKHPCDCDPRSHQRGYPLESKTCMLLYFCLYVLPSLWTSYNIPSIISSKNQRVAMEMVKREVNYGNVWVVAKEYSNEIGNT